MRNHRTGTPSRYKVGNRVLFSAGANRNRTGIVLDVHPEHRKVPEKYLISYRFYLPQQRTLERVLPTILCLRGQLLLVLDDELPEEEFLRMTPPEVQARYFSQ